MRKRVPVTLITLVTLCMLAPVSAFAQGGGQGRGGGRGQANPNEPVYPAQMTSRVEGGCGSCHNFPGNTKAPTRDQMRAMTPEQIVEILQKPIPAHDGKVQMSDNQRKALAELVTGKQFAGTPARDLSVMSNKCPAPLKLENINAKPHWNGWSPDGATNNRFVTAQQAGITAEQIPNLKVKWAFAFPDAASIAWSQPVVVGGAIFMGTDNNYVYALDAKTGCAHWAYNAKAQVRAAVSVQELRNNPNAKYAAYFGDMTGMVHAVNAETGAGLWTMRADDHPGSKITSAVMIDPKDGKVIVPVASWEEQTGATVDYECCRFQGSVVGVNANTGKQAWKAYAFGERPYSLGKKNSAGKDLYGPAGAGNWSSMVIDTTKRVVYQGLGNCVITEHFTRPDFDWGACDAVQAVDLDSGKKIWTTQLLATLSDRGRGRMRPRTGAPRQLPRLHPGPRRRREPNDDGEAAERPPPRARHAGKRTCHGHGSGQQGRQGVGQPGRRSARAQRRGIRRRVRRYGATTGRCRSPIRPARSPRST